MFFSFSGYFGVFCKQSDQGRATDDTFRAILYRVARHGGSQHYLFKYSYKWCLTEKPRKNLHCKKNLRTFVTDNASSHAAARMNVPCRVRRHDIGAHKQQHYLMFRKYRKLKMKNLAECWDGIRWRTCYITFLQFAFPSLLYLSELVLPSTF
jgi:hypothetical protein